MKKYLIPLLLLVSTVSADPVLSNVTYIEENGAAYIPSVFYFLLVALAFIFFTLSILIRRSDDINGILAAVFFAIIALLTASVSFVDVGFVESTVVPVSYHPYVPYISYLWAMMFFVSIINLYRIWHIKMLEAVQRKQQKEQMEFMEERQRRGI